MIQKLSILSLLGLILIFQACNKANDLGSFLEEDNEIDVQFDSVPLHFTTVEDQASTTWNLGPVFIPTNSAGRLSDPIFGEAKSILNFQLGIQSEPNFINATLDSVVLSLSYDTTYRSYGPSMMPMGLEVYRLDSDIFHDSIYKSNSSFQQGSLVGVKENFYPNFDDTLFVVEPRITGLDTVEYIPHLRIRLDENGGAFGQDLLDLELADFASNEIFREKIKGLIVRPTNSTEELVYFDMYDGLSRVNLYYTQGDTAKLMRFPVLNNNATTNVAVNTYEHDYSGSLVQEAIDNPSDNDSLLFVQSMGGPAVRIDFDDLSALDNSTINHAVLKFNLAYLAGDDTLAYPPINHLILEELTEDGEKILVADIGPLLYSNELRTFFGGDLREDKDGVESYSFQITRHLQKMIRGEASTTLIISNRFKGALANRSVLYGTSHPSLAPKLYLTYSEL